MQHVLERRGAAGRFLVAFLEPPEPVGFGQKPRDRPRGDIAGGALHRPLARQGFRPGKDLLHPDRRLRQAGSQAVQIAGGIGEPVDMIDPHAIDDARVDQLEEQAVHVLEHRVILDAHADKAGHVEEAAVADRVGLGAPVRQPPGLFLVQRADRIRLAVPAPPPSPGVSARGTRSPPATRTGPSGSSSTARPGSRTASSKGQGSQGRRIRSALGSHIEMARVAAALAVAQHVAQPGGLGRKRHVVRHDVEDQPQPFRLERRGQPLEPRAPTDLGLDLGGVGHVVAMRRARRRR